MTNRNRQQNPSELAEEIRRTLEGAANNPTESSDPSNHLRITKYNELIAPGEEVPKGPDGQPVPCNVVPDATFHAAGVR